MAKLHSEGLQLEIKDIVQYDTPEITDMYEAFDISLTVHDKPAFNQQVLHSSYELVSGNITYLINEIEEVLQGKQRETWLEFCEPNFEFQIKCLIDKDKDDLHQYLYPESIKENFYELVIWITSGNWNSAYSDTSVGGRFNVYRSELVSFLDSLKQEYENRKIEQY